MAEALSFKDYTTDQEVRWCPGCGDYAILKGIQRTLASQGAKPENTVFVSGIGCSSRLPYYVNAYGFHSIHGRAPAVASGIKLANPELDVWVITGDGDGLSIGGNHLLHALRRNIGLHILLFNNEIYGLTKGQYSPTSRAGTLSPTSPSGSSDRALDPGAFALGAGATLIAKCVDVDQARMPGLLAKVQAHQGAAFVEILQNCIVYNKDIWDEVANKKTAPQHEIWVEHGQPLLFGASKQQGLVLNTSSLSLSAVTLGENGISEKDVLVHDESNKTLAHLLLNMAPSLPTALGIIYRTSLPSFEQTFWQKRSKDKRLQVESLIRTGRLLDKR